MWRSWDELLDLWTRAERCGFALAFNTDHFQSGWGGDAGQVLEARVAALAPLGGSIFLVNIWPRSDPGLVDRAGAAFDGLRRHRASPSC
jgi:hypothetical protein